MTSAWLWFGAAVISVPITLLIRRVIRAAVRPAGGEPSLEALASFRYGIDGVCILAVAALRQTGAVEATPYGRIAPTGHSPADVSPLVAAVHRSLKPEGSTFQEIADDKAVQAEERRVRAVLRQHGWLLGTPARIAQRFAALPIWIVVVAGILPAQMPWWCLGFVALFFLRANDRGRKAVAAFKKLPPGGPGTLRAVALEGAKGLLTIDSVLGGEAIQFVRSPDWARFVDFDID